MDELIRIASQMHEVLTLDYLERTSDAELFEVLKKLSDRIILTQYNLKDQIVYRARIGMFRKLSDLLYPPKHLIKSYGRLNNIGESRFYCSTRADTSVLELQPHAGDTISVLELAFDSVDVVGVGMDLHSLIGTHPDDFRHALQGRIDLYSHQQSVKDLVKSDMANAFFYKLITSPSNEISHRITGVFSRHLFGVNGCCGVMYPCSVSTQLAMRFGAGNIALNTDFVDQYAKYIKISIYKIKERKTSFSIMKHIETIDLNC